MNNSEAEFTLKLRPSVTESISLKIPKETLENMKKVAADRDIAISFMICEKNCRGLVSFPQ